MRKLLFTTLLLTAVTACAAPVYNAVANDTASDTGTDSVAADQIRHIVTAFQAAIVARDGAALDAMFLPSDNSWLTVASHPARLKPGQPRVRPSTYRQFTDFVRDSKQPIEERFRDVRIHTNGSIGAVYFEFEFLIDGKVTNRGSESWHLVNTADGWKISSMVYSNG